RPDRCRAGAPPRARQPARRRERRRLGGGGRQLGGTHRHGRGRPPVPEQRPGASDRQDPHARHAEARQMTNTTSAAGSLGNLIDPTSAATTTGSASMSMLNQNDFLRLMTTQLVTQDPFNPAANTQMVAQMAQFSQVAGIAQMNQSLQQLVATLGGSRLTDAASWIGRSMLVESDIAAPLRDGSYAGVVDLPQ